MSDPRFEGKPLPQSRFAGDLGAIDPALAHVLAEHAQGRVGLREVQHALVGSRVLIPTAAGLDEVGVDRATGLSIEKSSHLAVATFISDAGWVGLLAFSSIDSVNAWDDAARPVPVTAEEAAASAMEDGRSVLVLDFAGPVRVALTGSLLRALAQGRAAVLPHVDQIVLEAVAALALAVPGVTGVRMLPPQASDLGAAHRAIDGVVALRIRGDSAPAVVAREVAAALASSPVLGDRCDGGFGIGIDSVEP